MGIWLITGKLGPAITILGTAPFSTAADYILTTVPMFILMAYFSSSSGLARDLFNASSSWFSHIRGGLAIATVFACGIFGAMSGASVAAASVMSNIAMPHMRRFGYSEELAAGAIGVGATLDILIPPSLAMIIYGTATETSVGKLLVAGVIPGIVLGILITIAIIIWVAVSPSHAPKTQRVSWTMRLKGLRPIWASLLLIVITLGLLYTGIATPTEVGALGAFTAAMLGFSTRRLSLAGAKKAIMETIRITSMIFMILVGATIFGYYMTLSQLPRHIMEYVISMNLNRWIIMAGIVVIYFVVSMFMDEIPLLLITLQMTFPLVISLGFDPIWYGVMCVMMICMGLVFPPVGLVAFVVSASANVEITKVYKGTSILVLAIIATAILLMIFPQLATWLPSTMR